MSAVAVRCVRLAVDILIAAAFVVLLATPIVWGQLHEWIGIAVFVLAFIHIVLGRKAVSGLVRKRRAGGFAALVLDMMLLTCLVGLAVSAVILSEHALSWVPVASGSWWARVVHLLCSYWGFTLAFVHVGLHLRAIAGAKRRPVLVWVGRVMFMMMGAFGALALAESSIWSYMTLSSQFVFIDFDESLGWRVFQYASMGVLIAGVTHYVSSIFRTIIKRQKGKIFTIPKGAKR